MNKVFKTKLIVIFSTLVFCGTVTAQQKDYAFYEQKTDSLIKEYSILENKEFLDFSTFFYKNQLSDKETGMLINKLTRLYDQG